MDVCDQANDMNDEYMRLWRLKRENEQAERMNRAGTEFCVECGVKIPVKRRAAVPGCSLCVKCQAELE